MLVADRATSASLLFELDFGRPLTFAFLHPQNALVKRGVDAICNRTSLAMSASGYGVDRAVSTHPLANTHRPMGAAPAAIFLVDLARDVHMRLCCLSSSQASSTKQ